MFQIEPTQQKTSNENCNNKKTTFHLNVVGSIFHSTGQFSFFWLLFLFCHPNQIEMQTHLIKSVKLVTHSKLSTQPKHSPLHLVQRLAQPKHSTCFFFSFFFFQLTLYVQCNHFKFIEEKKLNRISTVSSPSSLSQRRSQSMICHLLFLLNCCKFCNQS